MKQEWIERMHDQARAEKGVCTQASTGNWCDQHGALKFPGEEACRAMVEAYVIAESAGEVMEGLARTDAEDFFTTVTIPNIEAEIRNRLRAKWNDEGHAVMFNHAKDDLTAVQRVGKWLEEATR